MPNQLTPPSYPPSLNGGGARGALDKLLQRELKVDDPHDAGQVAQALLSRYRDDPRARAIAQEAQGLPFLLPPTAPAPAPQQGGAPATNVDLEQAVSDVERDLRGLATSSLTKDIAPEIEGWGQAILAAIQHGANAARLGIDTHSRDKAFAVRRQLGDYARLARLVGALTPPLNAEFRNLAQSLDEAAAVILVLMGEALANTGMAGGRYLLQVPSSELQLRRDVVINAWRNLSGSTQEAFGPSDWPRGIDAYRQLFRILEAHGQGALRSLMSEPELARTMDEMIQLAANGAARGLRALGATALVQLDRFVRFVQMTVRSVTPASPPLVAFQEALQMFVDGFTSAGGFRLLRIARPAILFYGLYGSDEVSRADRRLVQLVNNRGTIAGQLDCLTRCACDTPTVLGQIVGDRVLYDLDRAIDLYSVGEDDLGMPEVRASAYGFVLANAIDRMPAGAGELRSLLTETVDLLLPPPANTASHRWESASSGYRSAGRALSGWQEALLQELRLQQFADRELRTTVAQMTSNCIALDDVFEPPGCLGGLSEDAIGAARAMFPTAHDFALLDLDVPPALESSVGEFFGRQRDQDIQNNPRRGRP
jgi:hypothetical protein